MFRKILGIESFYNQATNNYGNKSKQKYTSLVLFTKFVDVVLNMDIKDEKYIL